MVDSIHSHGAHLPERGGSIRDPAKSEDAKAPIGAGPQASDGESKERTDRVELSDAARKLADQTQKTEDVPRNTLSPERVAEITKRLRDGYYDTEAVRTETARRLLKDL